MNKLEVEMLEILRRGKEKYGYAGVKAEFEAEGTRSDELRRLTEIAYKAGVNVGIKIGGCEAVRDLLDCQLIGADYIIAPMVETEYALSKYIDAKNHVYDDAFEQEQVRYLFNLETITGFNNLDAIAETAASANGASGIVLGRIDFTGSLGLSRDAVPSREITEYCIKVARKCKEKNLDFVVGGGVAKETLQSIKDINSEYLTRFETRKVIFHAEALDMDIDAALTDAVHFELLWLKNKFSYYSKISKEDTSRINMLEARWNELKSA